MKSTILILALTPLAFIPILITQKRSMDNIRSVTYAEVKEKSKIHYKNDTIYNEGKPYALMTSTNQNRLLAVYSIRTLLDSEIAIIKYDESIDFPDGSGSQYRFTFIGSGAYGHIDQYTEQGFAEVVVDNHLIRNNRLDPEAERRFLLVYPAVKRSSYYVYPADTARSR